MRSTVWNGFIVGGCSLALTIGYAHEQFSSQPTDVTSPAAEYAGGTTVVQPAAGFVASPPQSPVEPFYRLRELRWPA